MKWPLEESIIGKYIHGDQRVGGRDNKGVKWDDGGVGVRFKGPDNFHFVPPEQQKSNFSLKM